MKDPQNVYETGEKLLKEGNFDMASIYFDTAGNSFLEIGDIASAKKAYDKVLSCYMLMERSDLINEIIDKINSLD